MKFSTACLLSAAAAALTSPAFAQMEAPAVAAPEAQPAMAQPAAAPAPAAQPQVETNAAPGSQEAATAAAAAAAASRELPKVLPTTGDGATITSILTNICQPLVRGGDLEELTKANKIRKNRRTQFYEVRLEGSRDYTVSIIPGFGNNKNVCEMRVQYAIGADQPIIDALSIWAFLHKPQMVLRRNDVAKYEDVERVTTTWDNWANQMIDGNMFGLALSQINKLDGSPSRNAKFDEATIQYTIREATRPMVDAAGNAVAPGTPGAIDPNAPAAPAADPAAQAMPAAPTADPMAAPAAPAAAPMMDPAAPMATPAQ